MMLPSSNCVFFVGSHVIALMMLVLAPWLEGTWPVRNLALSDLRLPRHLQPGPVFPNTEVSILPHNENVSYFL